jgi:hypothetical protein
VADVSRDVPLTEGRVAFAPASGGVLEPSRPLSLVGEQTTESLVPLRRRSYGPSRNDPTPLRIFIGHDPRQPASVAVLAHSIARRASRPVAITPLVLGQLPIQRQGLTPFTYSRYLVPWLCGYNGHAVFLDADELVLGDIAELFACADRYSAVQVVKNAHRFEWPSVMLFDCGHHHSRRLTPEYVETTKDISALPWTDRIGELPPAWNHLVGYDAPRDDAKLVHFTQGVPAWDETKDCEWADAWRAELRDMLSMQPWADIMGNSVHAVVVDGKRLPRLKLSQLAARSEPPAA